MTIQLSNGEFVTALTQVRRVADDLVRQRTTAERRVEALLDGGWSGGAAATYAARWEEWRGGATEVLDALAQLTVLMEETRRGLVATDDRVHDDLTPLGLAIGQVAS